MVNRGKGKYAIVLCSGGLDSIVTSYYVKNRLKYDKLLILFFNYGQRTISQERKYSEKCAEKLNGYFVEINLGGFDIISESLINDNKIIYDNKKTNNIKKITRDNLKNTKKESIKYYVPYRNSIFLIYALGLAEKYFIKNNKIYDIFVGFKNEGGEAYPELLRELGLLIQDKNSILFQAATNNIPIFCPGIADSAI